MEHLRGRARQFKMLRCFHTVAPADPDKLLNEQLRDYFAIESCMVSPGIQTDSEDDKRARILLESTTRRIGNFFETGLL